MIEALVFLLAIASISATLCLGMLAFLAWFRASGVSPWHRLAQHFSQREHVALDGRGVTGWLLRRAAMSSAERRHRAVRWTKWFVLSLPLTAVAVVLELAVNGA